MKRSMIICFLAGFILTTNGSEAYEGKHGFPYVELSNNHVTMVLFLPDSVNGYYRSTRFDWSGVIYSLTYNGHEYFGNRRTIHDPLDPNSISGPVDGFIKPGLGYQEAKPGGEFVRIGIGIIEKPEEASYRMFEHYRIINHGKWEILKESNWIEFQHELSSGNGYGYVYKKRIELLENQPGFTISYSLKNTGKKVIETDQFNHNFFMIDKGVTGPDFTVTFPFTIRSNPNIERQGSENNKVQLMDNTLTFTEKISPEGHVWFNLVGFSEKSTDNGFEIINHKTGAGVRVSGSKALQRVIFWAVSATLCPEPYINIYVEPGETDFWSSTYTFFEI